MTLSFSVETDGTPALRDFLRAQGVSTGLLRAIKLAGGFFVDGLPAHADRRLHRGCVVSFALPDEPSTAVLPQTMPLCVLYEDVHAMVLNKPVGQTVHPTRGYAQGTLANAFCGEMLRRGTPVPFRPVNRIDRNTSGMVLCAMNAYAAPLLAKTVEKEYFALLCGEWEQQSGVIDAPIGLAEDSIIRRCVTDTGKPSRTQYTVLGAGGGCTLVQAVPLTGRTHQLRVHFAAAGHPLVGDTLYGVNETLPRHALHCGTMHFMVPQTKKKVCVRCALPTDMLEHCRRCGIAVPEMLQCTTAGLCEF